jgi:hypothetical protein
MISAASGWSDSRKATVDPKEIACGRDGQRDAKAHMAQPVDGEGKRI